MTDCPFCTINQDEVVAHRMGSYLIRAQGEADDYLVIPKLHREDLAEMGQYTYFLTDLEYLVRQIPWWTDHESYNISLNVGRSAGQRVKHLHWWIIWRPGPDDGLGLATLLSQHNLR